MKFRLRLYLCTGDNIAELDVFCQVLTISGTPWYSCLRSNKWWSRRPIQCTCTDLWCRTRHRSRRYRSDKSSRRRTGRRRRPTSRRYFRTSVRTTDCTRCRPSGCRTSEPLQERRQIIRSTTALVRSRKLNMTSGN